MKNIVQRNPRIKFEVYMHMYSDLHLAPFSSVKNGENNATLDSPDDIRALLDEGDIPAMLTTSSQSMFDESELSWLQQSDMSFFQNYPFQTLQNMFRQGNSLREAFLYRQKHNNHWNDNHNNMYIFARSDTFLTTLVDIPCSSDLGSTDVVVPSWGSWSGINDRFAIAGPDAAKVYASKIEGWKEAVLARRSNPEALPSFRNSETLLKNWLLGNRLNVTELEDDRAWNLLRVRADGRIEPKDGGRGKVIFVPTAAGSDRIR